MDAPESVTRTVTDAPESVTRTVTAVTPSVTRVTGVTAKATPVARRLLAEHGLAPSAIGEGRRVTKADVLGYLERRTPKAEPRPSLVPLSSMRKAIAEHMVRASQTIPHGQTVMQADLTRLAAWRDQHKAGFEAEHGAPLTYTVLFVQALARALTVRAQPVDLGVAVALDNGLIVPVIRAADSLTLGETACALADLASRARAGKLQPAETQGALMTVTNVGSFGNLFAAPIVPLHQIGILGPGLVEGRPLPAPDGGIRIGASCWLTLMFDRREFDDLSADRLLRAVVDNLISPR
jgi:pyruvate/2-oxoglutarate dehydrogenase complex dihydrolipoamide acyltransferase (E2) component